MYRHDRFSHQRTYSPLHQPNRTLVGSATTPRPLCIGLPRLGYSKAEAALRKHRVGKYQRSSCRTHSAILDACAFCQILEGRFITHLHRAGCLAMMNYSPPSTMSGNSSPATNGTNKIIGTDDGTSMAASYDSHESQSMPNQNQWVSPYPAQQLAQPMSGGSGLPVAGYHEQWTQAPAQCDFYPTMEQQELLSYRHIHANYVGSDPWVHHNQAL